MSMKPRVLQLVDSFHQGGTERQAVQLIRLLVDCGRYDVRVACLNREGTLLGQLPATGEVLTYPLTGFYNANFVRQTRKLAQYLRRERIQILQTHDFYTNIIGMAAGRLARVPVRIAGKRETGSMRTPLQAFVERRAFSLAQAIVVNASAVAKFLIASGVPERKLTTIYNGVPLALNPEFTSAERDARLDELDLPHRRLVTIVANLRHPVKDQETFLRAAKLVHANVPGAVFVVAGEGERLEELKNYATAQGVGDITVFTGRCTRVPELLSVSDIGVLSSINEGFSNSILEYQSAALPVVTTDVGGAREAVAEGESGYIVPVGDHEKMAAHIIALLQDPELRRRMGARGREIVEEKFSPAARLHATEALYAALLGGRQIQPDRETDAASAQRYARGERPVH